MYIVEHMRTTYMRLRFSSTTLLPTADVCFSPIVSTVGYYFPSTLASFLGGFSPQTSSPFASHSIGAFFLHFM
jgi:hypothetical protein